MSRHDLLEKIRDAAKVRGAVTELARALGLSRGAIYYKLKQEDGFTEEQLKRFVYLLQTTLAASHSINSDQLADFVRYLRSQDGWTDCVVRLVFVVPSRRAENYKGVRKISVHDVEQYRLVIDQAEPSVTSTERP